MNAGPSPDKRIGGGGAESRISQWWVGRSRSGMSKIKLDCVEGGYIMIAK